MCKRFVSLMIVLVTFCGEALADQVTSKNGDRVSGKIVKSESGKLVIKTELLGDVSVDLAVVTAITADQLLYVTLTDGRTVSGLLRASSED